MIMAEMKSYLIELSMEVLTEDDETVKAIHLHGVKNELIPLHLWCDFLERLGQMTPGEKVMLVTGEKRKPLVEECKGYIITERFGNFLPGDVFIGISNYELQHCRTGEVVRVNREMMDGLFKILGDVDPRWIDPISPETKEMIEKASKGWGKEE